MHETSKSIFSRIKDSRYATRYFVGDGIDIGSGSDPLSLYAEFFPLMKSCRSWDLEDGDAQYLESIPECSLDFVHSSHCLEHMRDIDIALGNWVKVLKPKGYIVMLVPDEDLYEQGVFPSTYNPDHKHTFTIFKKKSWSPNSINIFNMIEASSFDLRVLKIELLDSTHRYHLGEALKERFDQTLTPVGESAIEIVIQKN